MCMYKRARERGWGGGIRGLMGICDGGVCAFGISEGEGEAEASMGG